MYVYHDERPNESYQPQVGNRMTTHSSLLTEKSTSRTSPPVEQCAIDLIGRVTYDTRYSREWVGGRRSSSVVSHQHHHPQPTALVGSAHY